MILDQVALRFSTFAQLSTGLKTPSAAVLSYGILDALTNDFALFIRDGLVCDRSGPAFAARTAVVPYETSHTLIIDDAWQYLRIDSGSPVDLTVPPASSVPFAIGTQILLRQTGAGKVTIVQDEGVTVNSAQSLALRAQHSSACLIKVGVNEWDLAGDLEAA